MGRREAGRRWIYCFPSSCSRRRAAWEAMVSLGKMSRILILVSLLCVLVGKTSSAGYCGDGVCSGSEQGAWCSQDCRCGDRLCDVREKVLQLCPSECSTQLRMAAQPPSSTTAGVPFTASTQVPPSSHLTLSFDSHPHSRCISNFLMVVTEQKGCIVLSGRYGMAPVRLPSRQLVSAQNCSRERVARRLCRLRGLQGPCLSVAWLTSRI